MPLLLQKSKASVLEMDKNSLLIIGTVLLFIYILTWKQCLSSNNCWGLRSLLLVIWGSKAEKFGNLWVKLLLMYRTHTQMRALCCETALSLCRRIFTLYLFFRGCKNTLLSFQISNQIQIKCLAFLEWLLIFKGQSNKKNTIMDLLVKSCYWHYVEFKKKKKHPMKTF